MATPLPMEPEAVQRPRPRLKAHDCWSTNPSDSGPCGSAHSAFEVYGGNIVQSPNSATFSPVFSFGQSNGMAVAPYVHNITATFQNTGAQFYNSNYIPVGAKIESNIIYDNVTNIQAAGAGAAFRAGRLPGTGHLYRAEQPESRQRRPDRKQHDCRFSAGRRFARSTSTARSAATTSA